MKTPKIQPLTYKAIPYQGKNPQVNALFVAPNCFLIGDVVLKEGSSLWFGSTCRGDTSTCQIGKNTAIMEHTFVENSIIGNNSLLAHNVVAHHCQVGNNVLVGIGVKIIDGAKIGDNSLVGAGALILPNRQIPPNSVVYDKCKIVRTITETDLALIRESVQNVQEKARILKKSLQQQTG